MSRLVTYADPLLPLFLAFIGMRHTLGLFKHLTAQDTVADEGNGVLQ